MAGGSKLIHDIIHLYVRAYELNCRPETPSAMGRSR
jgi:hypothetical protein